MKNNNPYLFLGKVLFGKWKMILLHDIDFYGFIRFNQIIKTLPIPQKVLSEQLAELVNDGIIKRIQYNTIPLRVDYILSPAGQELVEITTELFPWAIRSMVDDGIKIDTDAFIVHDQPKYMKSLEDILPKLKSYKYYKENSIDKKERTPESGNLSNPYLYVKSQIGGKWKMPLLHKIHKDGYIRFNKTLREMPITKKVLAEELNHFVNNNLVSRNEESDRALLKVEYTLTEKGKTLIPIIEKLCLWAVQRIKNLNAFNGSI